MPDRAPVQTGSPEAARRLFAHVAADQRTLVEAYLRNRGITALHEPTACRFHPRCYYRPDARLADRDLAGDDRRPSPISTAGSPARIAPGSIPSGRDKAPIDTPRRAMGDLLGNAVRFGVANDVLAAGEGIETMLSLRCVLADHADGRRALGQPSRRHPAPADAAPALHRPRRRCGRRHGDHGSDRTRRRRGIEALRLSPRLGDFNEDLRSSASTTFGQLCASSSRRRTSPLHAVATAETE